MSNKNPSRIVNQIENDILPNLRILSIALCENKAFDEAAVLEGCVSRIEYLCEDAKKEGSYV